MERWRKFGQYHQFPSFPPFPHFSLIFLFLLLNGTASAERRSAVTTWDAAQSAEKTQFYKFVRQKDKEIKYKAILTKNLTEKTPVKKFECEDKIFLYFSWFDLEDNHSLSVFWHKPGGKLQETTEYNFTVVSKEFNTWLWLKLKKGKERGFILPGRGWTDFIGHWSVEIFLDGEFLERKQFLVAC